MGKRPCFLSQHLKTYKSPLSSYSNSINCFLCKAFTVAINQKVLLACYHLFSMLSTDVFSSWQIQQCHPTTKSGFSICLSLIIHRTTLKRLPFKDCHKSSTESHCIHHLKVTLPHLHCRYSVLSLRSFNFLIRSLGVKTCFFLLLNLRERPHTSTVACGAGRILH